MPSDHYTPAFFEEIRSGSARSAEIIAPLVRGLLDPRSVVDVGCGDGTWLAVFNKLGAHEILGIDGDYISRDLLQIPRDAFHAADLSKPLILGRTFDLAVSLEVAEHLPAQSARAFVESLTRLAPVVLFSAAIPLQGGNHHLNEQWPDYWAELFREHGFLPIDCIRRRVWQNDAVEWWYAQNALLFVQETFLVSHPALNAEFERTDAGQLRLVHPRHYLDPFARLEPPPWGVKTASSLLGTCLKSAATRKLCSIIGRKIPAGVTQNPPNYNSVFRHPARYTVPKRGDE